MTLNALINQLKKLQALYGRHTVAVDKLSLWDGNQTFNICKVESVDAVVVNIVDGDGFHTEDSRGRERTRINVVLSGERKQKKPKEDMDVRSPDQTS